MTFSSKTVKEFANELNIPLNQVLADLKKLGVYTAGTEILSQTKLEQLTEIYQKRAIQRDERVQEFKAKMEAKMLKQREEYDVLKLNPQNEKEAGLKQQEEIKADILKQRQVAQTKADEIKPQLQEWQIIRLKREEEVKANQLKRQLKRQEEAEAIVNFNFDNLYVIGEKEKTDKPNIMTYTLRCCLNELDEIYTSVWDNEEALIKWKNANSVYDEHCAIDSLSFESLISKNTQIKWALLNPLPEMTDYEISESMGIDKMMLLSAYGVWPFIKYQFTTQGITDYSLTKKLVLENPNMTLNEVVSNAEMLLEEQRRKNVELLEEQRRKLEEQNEIMNTELSKIGLVLDLCYELIPEQIAKSVLKNYNDHLNLKLGPVIFLRKEDGSLELPKEDPRLLIKIPKSLGVDYGIVRIPPTINCDYYLPLSIEQYDEYIRRYKKNNFYTTALIETIYFLLANKESYSIFEDLYPLGDLFIDIGAIDSALRLYNIDAGIFNTPNRLSLLANKAVQSGNLDDSIKLVGKLIKQEPYHPSIPTIQAEIKRLEQRHRLKSTFSIDFSKVDELSGVEFENLLMDKFVAMGFKAESTPKTGDFGADLIVENNEGTRIIVQCKRFKSKVNLKAVQEVVGAMGHYAGDMGIVITNNTFLNSAVKLAESHDIELWDGDKLVSFLAGDLSFSEIINVIE